MEELISRKAAIDALGERPTVWIDDDEYSLGQRNQYDCDKLAIETVPSAQPEPCEDAVSRKDVVKFLDDWMSALDANCHHQSMADLKIIKNDFENLPSVTPKAEQRWIPCSEEPDTDRNVFIARGTDKCMTVCVGHYDHDNKQWYEDRNWFAKCLYDGVYWCEMPPLPEPFREEGEQE